LEQRESPESNSRPSSLSILFPAFNDAGTIGSLVVLARSVARRLTPDFEIVVVNDGSQDYTASLLDELARLVPELRVLHHPVNLGYGAALRSGFKAATKDLLFYTDGDAQFDPREIGSFVQALVPGVDYVNGYREGRADPRLRALLGRPYHRLIRLAFGLRLRDIDCDCRLFRRHVLEQVELSSSNGVMSIELLRKLEERGCRFREVPVRHYPRVYGRSQYYTPRHVLHQYAQVFRLWLALVFRRRAHRSPLRPMAGLSVENERNLVP
jgi:glycosyltransferase involved in cell wall biosynthesis